MAHRNQLDVFRAGTGPPEPPHPAARKRMRQLMTPVHGAVQCGKWTATTARTGDSKFPAPARRARDLRHSPAPRNPPQEKSPRGHNTMRLRRSRMSTGSVTTPDDLREKSTPAHPWQHSTSNHRRIPVAPPPRCDPCRPAQDRAYRPRPVPPLPSDTDDAGAAVALRIADPVVHAASSTRLRDGAQYCERSLFCQLVDLRACISAVGRPIPDHLKIHTRLAFGTRDEQDAGAGHTRE